MKKRILSLVLGLAMLLSLLVVTTGCSNDGGNSGEVTLKWYVPGDKQADMASVMEEVNKITMEKIGAKVDLEFIDTGAYAEKMRMFMASGEEFDLAFTGYINEYYKAASEGGLMDITDIIKNDVPGLLEVIPETLIKSATINGKIYGIPNEQVMSNPRAIATYKDLEEKYNFKVSDVKHIEDLEPIFEKIKQNESNMYAIQPKIEYWTRPVWENVEDSSNVVIRKDGSTYKVELLQNTPEYRRAIQKTREYYQKGWIRPDAASIGSDSTEVNNGRYAFFSATYKPGGEDSLTKSQAGNRAVAVQMLTGPYIERHSPLLAMTSVGANSKHPVEAVKLIELINTDKDFYNLICYGIEGKHYTLTEEGKAKVIKDAGYAPNADWKFGNQFNAYVADGVDSQVWADTKKMNDEAAVSPISGFFPDKTKIQSELSQIANINSEFKVLVSGAVDPDEYLEKYLKKLEEAGQQKVLEEFQRQVDEFVAKKNK